jgi:hypothetical protein
MTDKAGIADPERHPLLGSSTVNTLPCNRRGIVGSGVIYVVHVKAT